jgi:AraC-like DNA-binding protein
MLSLLLNDLKRFKDSLVTFENFQDDVLLVEFDRFSFESGDPAVIPAPQRCDALMFLGISEGELDLSVDYIRYRISENAIAWIIPAHITQMVSVNPNVKGWMLIITKSFLEENFYSKNTSTLISYIQLKKHPFNIFEPEEFQALYKNLQNIQMRMKQQTHLFHKEVIVTALKSFSLDMMNFFLGKKENVFFPELTRKEEIFTDFLTLLTKHCREQHEVSFYAGKLCVTSQYLSLSLKEQSGRSASQWIQEALMVEAKGMLKSQRMSVQEVAYDLNFPDQSTFGKFFKKHTGLSPMAFRKS